MFLFEQQENFGAARCKKVQGDCKVETYGSAIASSAFDLFAALFLPCLLRFRGMSISISHISASSSLALFVPISLLSLVISG